MATLTADQLLNDYIATGQIAPKAAMKKAGSALVFACLDRALSNPDNKLHLLYEAACPAMPSLTEPELRRVLQLTIQLRDRLPPYGVALLLPYLDEHDLTPGLASDIRELITSQDKVKYIFFSQAGGQLFQQRLHLLSWLGQWDELDPEKCWSELIRHDLRAMADENRARWRGLFRSLRADGISRLKPKDIEAAQATLRELGMDEFRRWIERWFYPFSQEPPLPLSVAGSHILKGLLLYCGVAKDPAANQAALWVLTARWKQKKNVDKVMVALLSVLEGMSPEDAWQPLLQLQENRAIQGGQIEGLLKQIATAMGISEAELRQRRLLKPEPPRLPKLNFKARMVEIDLIGPRFGAQHPMVDGEDAVVEGALDRYRVSLKTGRIVRESDQAVLMLDPSRLPAELRPFLDLQIESEPDPALRSAQTMLAHIIPDSEPNRIPPTANPRQVCLRIAMLKEDSVYGGAFVSLDQSLVT